MTTPNSTVSETVSTEHKQALEDRAWWREAGDIIGLELRGWTYRNAATFADRDTGRSVELPGSVANRLRSLSTGTDAGVRVRKLEWGERRQSGTVNYAWDAKTSIGWYIVATASGEGCKGSYLWFTAGDTIKGWANSEAEAKAAAQADYEQRVCFALEQQPAASQVYADLLDRQTETDADIAEATMCNRSSLYLTDAPTQDKASPGMEVVERGKHLWVMEEIAANLLTGDRTAATKLREAIDYFATPTSKDEVSEEMIREACHVHANYTEAGAKPFVAMRAALTAALTGKGA